MLKEYILTDISTKDITYEPGGSPVSFDVTVINNSDQFATFQVELLAAGTSSRSTNWYTILPEVCTKKPPGDVTLFSISIIDTPKAGFTGLIKLTVRVFSLELPSSESRQVIRLLIPGSGISAPQLDLPNQEFNRYPGESFQIPISLESFNQRASNVTLRLSGIDAAWFPDGVEKRLLLQNNEKTRAVFECHIPELKNSASGNYTFTIEAHQAEAPVASVQGLLKILPQGFVTFNCINPKQSLPENPSFWQKQQKNFVEYTLEFDNQSNLSQEANIQISDVGNRRKQWLKLSTLLQRKKAKVKSVNEYQAQEEVEVQSEEEKDKFVTPPLEVELSPQSAKLSLTEPTQFHLTVKHPRPWFGWRKRKVLQAQALTNDNRIEVFNDTQTLTLEVLPLIHEGAQLGGLAMALLLSLGLGNWLLNLSQQHKNTINTVRFNGVATEVISGANDQTVRSWSVKGNKLEPEGILAQTDKAVRVIRYRPVNNDRIAVGYENGQIQLIDLLTGVAEPPFTANLDDRVFDLTFTKDSRALFSGHGSGQVVEWNLDKGITKHSSIVKKQQVGFAVNALALVGEADSHLAIAGRFNQLTLWDLKTNKLHQITANGSDKNYILSLATSDSKPNMLVTGDNQGKIKVWNMRACLTSKDDCQVVDEWNADAQSVRAVALSNDGCYLASAGEDGEAKLWTLNARGERSKDNLAGKVITTSAKTLTSIDIVRNSDGVSVTTGGEDRQVTIHQISKVNFDCR